VVVSDVGGPCELMEDGVTGLKVTGRDADALYQAMVALMDPATRARMGKNARAFVEQNRVDEPFTAILDSEAYRRRLHEAKVGPEAPSPHESRRLLHHEELWGMSVGTA
jgi:hypothetical protein